jgi:toxin ParE1/3/4
MFLAAVQEDLVRLLRSMARRSGSVSVAHRCVREGRDSCHQLAAVPGTLGRARPELRSDLRSVPYKHYVLFCRSVADRFEVVTILEGHRDLIASFGDETACSPLPSPGGAWSSTPSLQEVPR